MDLSTRDGRRIQGERLKLAAKEAGITLDELARAIGCSRALIFQYASGASLAQTDRLQQIAAIVGKPLYWFFITDADAGPTQSPTDLVAGKQQELDEAISRFETERARTTERRIREDIANLEALLTAHSSPPDQRRIVECCQKLQPLLTSIGDNAALASVMLKQGNALIALQDWGSARESLQQAADRYQAAGKAASERDCLQSMGHASLMLGRVTEALHLFERVANSDDWTNRWQGTLSCGAAYEFQGEYTRAIAAFEDALRIVEEHTGADTEIPRLFVEANWANLELDFGDFRRAHGRAVECGRTAQRNGVQDQYIEAQLTAGIANLHLGEMPESISRIRTASDLALLTGSKQYQSLALSCESLWLTETGRTEQAISCGKEALAIALRSNVLRAEILAQRALCEAYLAAAAHSEARYHAEQGYAAANSHGIALAGVQFVLLGGWCSLVQGDLQAALVSGADAYSQAEAMQVRPLLLEASLLLADAALRSKDLEGALAYARRSVQLSIAMETKRQLWQALAAEAFVLQALGREDDMLRVLTDACGKLHALRAATPASEDRTSEHYTAERLWKLQIEMVYLREGEQAAESLVSTMDWLPAAEWLQAVKDNKPTDWRHGAGDDDA